MARGARHGGYHKIGRLRFAAPRSRAVAYGLLVVGPGRKVFRFCLDFGRGKVQPRIQLRARGLAMRFCAICRYSVTIYLCMTAMEAPQDIGAAIISKSTHVVGNGAGELGRVAAVQIVNFALVPAHSVLWPVNLVGIGLELLPFHGDAEK